MMTNMEKRNFGELVKIAAVGTILLILLGGALLLRQKDWKKTEIPQMEQPTPKVARAVLSPTPTFTPAIGKYMLIPENNRVTVGQIFQLTAKFWAPGKILDGSDVILHFDPGFLEARQIVEGDYFSTYPRKTVDNKTGIVKITGIGTKVDTPLSETASFAKISYRVKKTGTTQVTFDFVRGKTNQTTLVERGTSRNILGNVFPVTITIEP